MDLAKGDVQREIEKKKNILAERKRQRDSLQETENCHKKKRQWI